MIRATARILAQALRAASTWGLDMSEAFAGISTHAGVKVNTYGALKQPEIRTAQANLAWDISRMPIRVLQTDDAGRRTNLRQHEVFQVLNHRANPHMTAIELRRQMIAQLLAHGHSFTRVERSRDFRRVVRLWPMDYTRLRILGDIEPESTRGYFYRGLDGIERELRPDEIVQLSDFNLDGQIGRSRLLEASEALGLTTAVHRYASLFFSKNGRPTLLLKHATGFASDEDEEETIKAWNERYSGQNAHGVGFLKNGLEVADDYSPNNNEGQMLETRRFQKEVGAMLHRIPPHMLQDLTRGTFSNISRQSTEYVVYALLGIITLIEQACEQQLLNPLEQDREIQIRHNVKSLLRGDVEKQASFYRTMIQWGVMTPNEARQLEDLDPIPAGDVFLRPLNMIAVDRDGVPVPGQPHVEGAGSGDVDPNQLDDDARAALRQAVEELLEEYAHA